MKIFMCIVIVTGAKSGFYQAITVAENEDEAKATAFLNGAERFPGCSFSVAAVDDVTSFVHLHHVNGEVVK